MASSVILFLPPVPYASVANAVWMGFWLSVLLFFFTFYVGPWLALIPELTHNDTERVNMTILQAAFSMVGVIMVMIGGILWLISRGRRCPCGHRRHACRRCASSRSPAGVR